MKIARVLAFSILMLPMMGAEDSGCGGGTGYEQPGVVPRTEQKCTPQTCENGCCLADVCYKSQTREACGSFGAQCVTCQGLQSCLLDPDTTKGQVCRVDSSSKWVVRPALASIPLLDPSDGASWDADDSAPDVLVELSCPASSAPGIARTSEISSYTPEWIDGSCSATLEEWLKSPVGIKMLDVDAFFDDQIFSDSYMFKDADFGNGFVDIPIAADGTSKLRLKITRMQ